MNPEVNLISLTLTNVSTNDSEVDLFSFGERNRFIQNLYYVTCGFDVAQDVQGFIDGVPFTDSFAEASMELFVQALNTFYSGNLIFTYSEVSVGNYTLYGNAVNPSYSLSKLIMLSSETFDVTEVISGSTVSVETNNLTYTELCNELEQQPYKIDTVNIYTDSLIQANQRFKKVAKTAFGTSSTDYARPKIDPMQNQFAIENIETKFTPSPINVFNYNLKGSESVRVWCYYKRVDIDNFTEVKKIVSEDKSIEVKKPFKMIKIEKTINPIFDLVGVKEQKRITVKDSISPNIENREITDEEVYTSFDGLDFTEL